MLLLTSLALAEDPLSIVASDRDVAYGAFGSSAAAGDWDGDGLDDIAIGAPDAYDGGNDSGAAYVGSFDGGELSTVLRGKSPQHNGQFGWSMGSAGDVDGDGTDDLLVGAPTEDGDNVSEGVVWLFTGSATGLDPSPLQQLNGSLDAGAAFGFAIVGDFDSNGNGYTEVAVGAPNDEGVYWFESDTNRFDLERMRSSSTEIEDSGYGFALTAGDYDADGLDDVVVGAPHIDGHKGAVFVHDAGALGGVALSSTIALEGARFGAALADGGDVDADGYSDLVVGALGDSQKFSQSGAVYVYLGSSNGLTTLWEYLLLPLEGAANDQFGARVAASDLDGDGFTDVIAAAPPADDSAGGLHIFPGSASGPDISGEFTWTADDTEAGDELGAMLLGGIDLDADGVDDLLVGAPGDDEERGSAWLLWGCRDEDLDGLCIEDDCDDTSDAVGAPIGWYWVDADSDGYGDPDGYEAVCFSTDGFVENGDDCDDGDAATHPNAAELESGCMRDADEDGYGDAAAVEPVDAGTDCDDDDGAVHPDAEEGAGDQVDQDCNGQELCYDDDDDDGFRDETIVLSEDLDCDDAGEAYDTEWDCNDTDDTVYPGAQEIPGDGVDQDCDGADVAVEDTGSVEEEEPAPEGCGCGGGVALAPWFLALFWLRRR